MKRRISAITSIAGKVHVRGAAVFATATEGVDFVCFSDEGRHWQTVVHRHSAVITTIMNTIVVFCVIKLSINIIFYCIFMTLSG